MSTNNQSVLRNFAVIRVLPFQNNPKDLDLSYKMDLDFWDCFGRKKTPSYKRRNTVCISSPEPSAYMNLKYYKHFAKCVLFQLLVQMFGYSNGKSKI